MPGSPCLVSWVDGVGLIEEGGRSTVATLAINVGIEMLEPEIDERISVRSDRENKTVHIRSTEYLLRPPALDLRALPSLEVPESSSFDKDFSMDHPVTRVTKRGPFELMKQFGTHHPNTPTNQPPNHDTSHAHSPLTLYPALSYPYQRDLNQNKLSRTTKRKDGYNYAYACRCSVLERISANASTNALSWVSSTSKSFTICIVTRTFNIRKRRSRESNPSHSTNAGEYEEDKDKATSMIIPLPIPIISVLERDLIPPVPPPSTVSVIGGVGATGGREETYSTTISNLRQPRARVIHRGRAQLPYLLSASGFC
ncbi:hypothetical protein F5878DRAFT_647624 [Lentinula raphanica]|uniref:Uncharacterized protein n=1 Tax=Lentinula raphanica TaxID=153919 RepID=A0AA38NVS1_9AGAR|nr:hypothetical protein F5878DRAFT_647624 [Lentinula raphanica]